MPQCFDTLLGQGESSGLVWDSLHEGDIGLVFRDGSFRIRLSDCFGQVEAGDGIIRSESNGFFKGREGCGILTEFVLYRAEVVQNFRGIRSDSQ